MLKASLYSALCYGLSAIVFLGFTVVFTRHFGVAAYGQVSILLNSLSALTLLGNYHGYLVSHSVATDRSVFRLYFLRAALPYIAVVTPLAAAVFGVVTGMGLILTVVAAGVLALLIASGMPVAVITATKDNWRSNACRAVYQVTLVAAFWPLFAGSRDAKTSFVFAALVAAVVLFALLFRFAARRLRSGAAEPAPSGSILIISAISNISIMLTLLADKFAINHLSVGADQRLAGLYLLNYDILSRASAVFVIMVCPLTYLLLDRLRRAEPVATILRRLAIGALALGGACVLAGYVAVPALYGTSITEAPLLPLFIALVVVGQALGSAFGAYCNAVGRGRVLMWQNAAVFVVVAAGIAALEWRHAQFSVTQLALVLALGNGLNALAFLRIVASGERPMPHLTVLTNFRREATRPSAVPLSVTQDRRAQPSPMRHS
jgi:O-antigen/teichoic acid export membrane protein